MRLAALCSGGKDSSYALWSAVQEGHEISELVTMLPKSEDSWMFHQPSKKIMELFAEAAKIKLVTADTPGVKEEEVKDLKSVIENLRVGGIVSGAVRSNYQRDRLEKICKELGISCLTPLWQKDPIRLLKDIVGEKFEILITSVSAAGLEKNWLGRKLDMNSIEKIIDYREKYGIHPTGEGGEYETLVVDAPFFTKKIKLDKTEKIWKGDRGHLEIKKASLIEKKSPNLAKRQKISR